MKLINHLALPLFYSFSFAGRSVKVIKILKITFPSTFHSSWVGIKIVISTNNIAFCLHQFSISFVMELAAASFPSLLLFFCYFYATKNVYKRFHVVILFKFNFHYIFSFFTLTHSYPPFTPHWQRTNFLAQTTENVLGREVHYVSYCYNFLFLYIFFCIWSVVVGNRLEIECEKEKFSLHLIYITRWQLWSFFLAIELHLMNFNLFI